MPLQTQTLKAGIKSLLDESWANTTDSNQARIYFADRLGQLIDDFVRSGLVTVNTTGSSSAQSGTGNIT